MPHGGTAEFAKQLAVDEHIVVETLAMQDQDGKPLLILMHGNRQVSLKNLAREINAKKVEPCQPEVAERHTGYQISGPSPFATRKSVPIYVERMVLALPTIFMNGGRHGFLVEISPAALSNLLCAQPVGCAALV